MSGFAFPQAAQLAAAGSVGTQVDVNNAALWGRKLSLVVADKNGNGIELVQPSTQAGDTLHVIFTVRHLITSSPNIVSAKIYNLSKETIAKIQHMGVQLQQAANFDSTNGQIILKAGYQGRSYGTIFQGSIRYVKIGRENPTDTYIDIFGADTDYARNWGYVNFAMAAGYSQQDAVKAAHDYMSNTVGLKTILGTQPTLAPDISKTVPVKPPDKSPRGRLMYGMVRDVYRDIATAHDNSWSYDAGTLNFLPRTAYRPGDAVVLSPTTGLIGFPQLADNGLRARCLLNPSLGVGARVHIDMSLIQPPSPSLVFNVTNQNTYATLNPKGFYKILTVDHTGDNRGQNWYSDIVCISIDTTASQGQLPMTGVQDLATDIPP